MVISEEKIDCRGDDENQRRVIDALFECEAQKKAMIDGFPGILVLFDRDMKARWVNNHTLRFCTDFKGKKCYEIFCSKSDDCSSCAFVMSRASGMIEKSTQLIGVFGDDGEEMFFDITCSPVVRGGDVSGFVVIAQNVTERRQLEKQLRHTQKMEAIGTLAGGVAHDFNNVLTPIMGYTEIIRLKMKMNGLAEGAVYDYLAEILKASKRAKTLVEQFLTFSRSIEKKEVLQHIHPIVKEAMKLMRVTMPSTITIKEDVDENCGRVLVDPVQIHQVLINLCTNAAQAMAGRHGVLTVTLKPATSRDNGVEWLELNVTDTGCGIEKQMLDRIFEPYFTTREKTSGTGMGLAVVHGIVNHQGGHIEVESELGKGSSFRVFFPIVKDVNMSETAVFSGELQHGDGTILLVDDEEQVVQVTGEILENFGYTVVGKTSAAAAIELFAAAPDSFDLLLTDLTMPELTGLELSEKVKTIRPDIPVILFTGYSDQVSKDAAAAAGVDEYCMKPVSMNNLSFTVSKVLKSKKSSECC